MQVSQRIGNDQKLLGVYLHMENSKIEQVNQKFVHVFQIKFTIFLYHLKWQSSVIGSNPQWQVKEPQGR